MRRAFSLIELLVVITIIAILSAILFPAFATAKGAALQLVGVSNLRSLGSALSQYSVDHDETFMPAMGADERGYWAWFGRPAAKGTDESEALLQIYQGRRKLTDPAQPRRKEYLGDQSGFGYNWGYIGSDMHVTGHQNEFPQCYFPAKLSDLGHPSTTLLFATSGFHNPKWQGGDGLDYDFGFVDPVGLRSLNPNVSFHHIVRAVDDGVRMVLKGNALVVMADGRARTVKRGALKDDWFTRGEPPRESGETE